MVRDFHENARAVINDKPTLPSPEVVRLRLNLITEELHELEAHGFGVVGKTVAPDPDGYMRITNIRSCNPDLVKIADAVADLLYVVLGTAVSCGIDIEPVYTEVHRSNMTKFIDGGFRDDGKYVKGPSYQKADIKRLIEEQSLA